MSLIAVVMKAPTSAKRFKNASSLLDFGFANFEYKKMISKDDVIKNVKIEKGVISEANVIAEKNCGTLIKKGNDLNIEQKIEMPDVIQAPVKKGDIVGKVIYRLNEKNIGECNLIVMQDIDKIGFFNMERYVLNKWFSVLR